MRHEKVINDIKALMKGKRAKQDPELMELLKEHLRILKTE